MCWSRGTKWWFFRARSRPLFGYDLHICWLLRAVKDKLNFRPVYVPVTSVLAPNQVYLLL